MTPGTDQALVLAETAARSRRRALTATIAARRDELADLELELAELRVQLADFEVRLELALVEEQQALDRVERVLAALAQWTELVHRAATGDLVEAARAHERRRRRRRRPRPRRRPALAEPPATDADERTRLKRLFHRLARRYHPDLAGSEPERLHHGRVMARVTALYQAGNLTRLEALAAEVPDDDLDEDPAVDLEQLEARLAAVALAAASLRDERDALLRCPTAELRARATAATAAGEDLFATLREELRARLGRGSADIRWAINALEDEVRRHNRSHATALEPRRRADGLQVFDPLADHRLVRLSRQALAARQAAPQVRALTADILARTADAPGLRRLLCFTHVTELSPFPLGGLDSYAELERRYQTLADVDAPPLPEALAALEEWVEFGVRRATRQVAHTGLRFRHPDAQAATALALESEPMRRQLKEVLTVVGERARCAGCAADVHAVPLYRTRGLDDLRAHVCPRCGAVLASYFMPKGQDLQAVLNEAFREHGLVVELTFRLSRAHVATQLVPIELETMTVGRLKARLFADLFARYRLPLKPKQLLIVQHRRPLPDRTPLVELDDHRLTLRFAGAKLTEAAAVEQLRHRVRHRFDAPSDREG